MSGLHNYDSEIHALDERIGRLAILCGVDISRAENVMGLIKSNFAVCMNRDAAALEHQKELRALLVMKYHIEVSCINSIGAAECAKLISQQDEQLRRSGFPPQSVSGGNHD
ncbi:MAG: hypothetical protein QM709_08720 [Spongiibacteraceae bacterium]